MVTATQAQYAALKGTGRVETAVKRNLAYFAVASRLIDPAAALCPPKSKVKSQRNSRL